MCKPMRSVAVLAERPVTWLSGSTSGVRTLLSYGRPQTEAPWPVDGDTVFVSDHPRVVTGRQGCELPCGHVELGAVLQGDVEPWRPSEVGEGFKAQLSPPFVGLPRVVRRRRAGGPCLPS